MKTSHFRKYELSKSGAMIEIQNESFFFESEAYSARDILDAALPSISFV